MILNHMTAFEMEQAQQHNQEKFSLHIFQVLNSFCLTILFKCSFCVTNAFLKLQTFRAVSRSVRTVNHMQNCCIKSVMFYQITL